MCTGGKSTKVFYLSTSTSYNAEIIFKYSKSILFQKCNNLICVKCKQSELGQAGHATLDHQVTNCDFIRKISPMKCIYSKQITFLLVKCMFFCCMF